MKPPKTDPQRIETALKYAGAVAGEKWLPKESTGVDGHLVSSAGHTVGAVVVVIEPYAYDPSKTQRVLVSGRQVRGLTMAGPLSKVVVSWKDGNHSTIRLTQVLMSPKTGDHYDVLVP